MTKPANRYKFEEIVRFSEDTERTNFELKNSSYLLMEHPLQEPKIAKAGYGALKEKLYKMLSETCSGLANAAGGTLVIGFHDNGTLDDNPVPDKWNNTPIDKFVEDLLKSHIHPPLDTPEVYICEPDDQSGNRVLVIEVKAGHRAHQAWNKLYYARRTKGIEALYDHEIQDIRNRRIHPKLNSTLLEEECKVLRLEKIPLGRDPDRLAAVLRLAFRITNDGSVIARDWAARVHCKFAQRIIIDAPAVFSRIPLYLEGEGQVQMVKSEHPLYPTQSVNMIVEVTVPVYLEVPVLGARPAIKSMQWLGIKDSPSEWWSDDDGFRRAFRLDFTSFAESAEPESKSFEIWETEFWPKLENFITWSTPEMMRKYFPLAR